MADDDEIVDATPTQIVRVIEQMTALPWPDGDGSLEWEIDGVEGETTWLAHLLGLAATTDAAGVAALTTALSHLADERWGDRRVFDARPFTDPEFKDRRVTAATLVRALGAETALWWTLGNDAVMLIDNTSTSPELCKAAVLVMQAQWLAGPGAEEEALEAQLVDDFLSKDGRRVLHAVWEVVATRDPEVLTPLVTALPAIERATDDVELGGALASNARHLDHALDRIRIFGRGDCLCAAYPAHQFYEPEKEDGRGHVRIVEEIPVFYDGRPDRPKRVCACTACGQRYEVEEGEYHYTWWKWTRWTGES